MPYEEKMAFYLDTVKKFRQRRSIIYIDEMVVTERTYKRMAFSRKGTNVNVKNRAS